MLLLVSDNKQQCLYLFSDKNNYFYSPHYDSLIILLIALNEYSAIYKLAASLRIRVTSIGFFWFFLFPGNFILEL